MKLGRFALALTMLSFVAAAAGASAQEGLSLLPANVPALVVVKDLPGLYSALGVDGIAQQNPGAWEKARRELVQHTGLNLLDVPAMHAAGVDVEGTFYVAAADDSALTLFLLLPSMDPAGFVERTLEEHGDDFPIRIRHDGQDIHGNTEGEIALLAATSYVVMVLTNMDKNGQNAVEAAKRMRAAATAKSLAASDDYRRCVGHLDPDGNLYVYTGRTVGKLASRHRPRGNDAFSVDGPSAMLVRVAEESIVVEGFTLTGKDAPELGWRATRDPVPFLKRVPANPMLMILARINAAPAWATLRSRLAEAGSADSLDAQIRKLGANVGVDIEQDIISQVNGNVAFITNNASLMGLDIAVALQLNDPVRFRTTLARITARLSAQIAETVRKNPGTVSGFIQPQGFVEDTEGGVAFYRMDTNPAGQVCAGIIDDHLIITARRADFAAIVAGQSGVATTLPNPAARTAIADAGAGVFYVDFRALAEAIAPLAAMVTKTGEEGFSAMRDLRDGVCVSRTEIDGLRFITTVTAVSPGAWKRLLASMIGS